MIPSSVFRDALPPPIPSTGPVESHLSQSRTTAICLRSLGSLVVPAVSLPSGCRLKPGCPVAAAHDEFLAASHPAANYSCYLIGLRIPARPITSHRREDDAAAVVHPEAAASPTSSCPGPLSALWLLGLRRRCRVAQAARRAPAAAAPEATTAAAAPRAAIAGHGCPVARCCCRSRRL